MITEADIIRLLSDPRFERTVLAILRKRLSNYNEPEEHVSESSKPLPTDWGWIPIALAAKKYGLIAADIDAAIAQEHLRGNGTHVDEDVLRIWAFSGNAQRIKLDGRALPALETELPVDLEAPAAAPEPESYSIAEAAVLLSVTEERLTEHLLAGTLKQVGEDRVSKTSVHKHREHLLEMGLVGPMPVKGDAHDTHVASIANAVQTRGTMSVLEAAQELGTSPVYASALASRGVLVKVQRGVVTRDSVEAFKLLKGDKKRVRRHGPPPETKAPFSFDQPEGDAEETMTMVEAGIELGMKMNSASALASMGRLVKVRRGVVTRASVMSYKARATRVQQPGELQEA